jgi:hypothetical protein
VGEKIIQSFVKLYSASTVPHKRATYYGLEKYRITCPAVDTNNLQELEFSVDDE